MADLERTPLDTAWDAEVDVETVPTALDEDIPWQVHLEGPVSIDPTEPVQLTALDGTLNRGEEQIPLTPVRTKIGDAEAKATPELLDEDPSLEDGDPVVVTLLPEHAADIRFPAERVNVTAELQYRYRSGDAFDAGRFVLDTNATPSPSSGLGVGVPRTTDAGVHEIIFKDLGEQAQGGPVTIHAFHVGDGTAREANLTGTLEDGEGVAIVTFDAAHETQAGDGYLLFHVQTPAGNGVAAHPDEEAQDPLPLPFVLAVVALFAGALVRRR